MSDRGSNIGLTLLKETMDGENGGVNAIFHYGPSETVSKTVFEQMGKRGAAHCGEERSPYPLARKDNRGYS